MPQSKIVLRFNSTYFSCQYNEKRQSMRMKGNNRWDFVLMKHQIFIKEFKDKSVLSVTR